MTRTILLAACLAAIAVPAGAAPPDYYRCRNLLIMRNWDKQAKPPRYRHTIVRSVDDDDTRNWRSLPGRRFRTDEYGDLLYGGRKCRELTHEEVYGGPPSPSDPDAERRYQDVTAEPAPQIPKQYYGMWCMIEPYDQEPRIFKRCRAAEAYDETSISIGSNFFFQTEHSCTLLAITAAPGGHEVTARCVHHADIANTPEWVKLNDIKGERRVQRWRLIANGRRLEVK